MVVDTLDIGKVDALGLAGGLSEGEIHESRKLPQAYSSHLLRRNSIRRSRGLEIPSIA